VGIREEFGNSPRRAYGDAFAERFGLEKQNFHVTRTLKRGILAVTQIKSDFPTPEPSPPVEYDEAHLVGFQVWNSPDHELWQEGKPAKFAPFKSGEVAFYDLRRAPSAFMRHGYNSLQFYLPHAALNEIAQQHGMRFGGELRYQFGVPKSDPIIRHLGSALLPALERREPIDGLFLDHILHALATHVVAAHGEADVRAARLGGGLAGWQERRVKELMQANLSSDISLKQLAGECGLSVAHFARAFRQSAKTSPHRWLRERRIERAITLLGGADLSLSDIAIACGFSDQSHFTRSFTKQIGVSPGQWRRHNGSKT
jgi:AraC-like DNA-binding protein